MDDWYETSFTNSNFTMVNVCQFDHFASNAKHQI